MNTFKTYNQSSFFCCMSQEELREHELECEMKSELSEMWQMDNEDLFEAYGVEIHLEAEEIIIESFRDIA